MNLLWWATAALALAIAVGALGYTGITSGAALVARRLFAILLVLFVALLIAGLLAGEKLFMLPPAMLAM